MATKKPRLNVTMEPREEKVLAMLAKKEHKSISFLIRELILEALERREDMVLSDIADNRLKESKETISHEEAWKDVSSKA